MLNFKCVFVGFLVFFSAHSEITDSQYALMPDLFYLDNFDQCLINKNNEFCTFTFTLKPSSANESSVWKIIKTISDNPQNYRHDRLRHGICVAKSCAEDYDKEKPIKSIVETCYNNKYSQLGLKGNVSELICQNNKSALNVDIYDIVFGVIVLSYILFVIFASIYEQYKTHDNKLKYYEKPSSFSRFLEAFSLPKNWHRLRSTKNTNKNYRKLKSIQGIRFYNMICVILSHTIMGTLGGPVSNPQYTENSTKKILNMFIANGWYIVQSFFLISGWLLSYHFFEMTSGNKKFKITYLLFAVLNRYIRLVPAVAFMVGFHATWFVHLSTGPYWDMFVAQEYRNCRKNWWTNILFINNYFDNNNMCLHQTWYIAADMQLFIVSVIVLYVIWSYPKTLKFSFGVLLFVGFVSPGIVAYLNNYDIIVRQYPEVLYNLNLLKLDHWHKLYSSAYSNIFGYAIGMVFGYLFFTYKNASLNIKKVHVIAWWLLTFGMCTFLVLIAAIFYNPDFVVTPLNSAIYWSCGKNLFALGIAIGIFGFTQKIGWFARWFLEFEPVQVLGRLTYSTYIIHVAFIRWQIGYRRYPVSANDCMIFLDVLKDVTISYLGGALVCLLLEMPVSALQKLMGFKQNKVPLVNKSSEKSLETLDLDSGNNGQISNS